MYDKDGVRILSDAELNSDSAQRLQRIEWRLVRIIKQLGLIAVAMWILVLIATYNLIRH
ncbi:hypothetical protein ACVWYH_003204 [Bradyrhizobium sp. GM24.11]|jgi:hypothetical protein